jgi:hypothetical protein
LHQARWITVIGSQQLTAGISVSLRKVTQNVQRIGVIGRVLSVGFLY